ncbi:MAG: helix-turn-helix domain-containing protein [Fusicatenibacter sp.]
MNPIVPEMGQRIAMLRRNKKLTQEELADRSGVSLQTISTAERGVKALRPENIVKISQALDTSTDYLLTGNPNSLDYSIMNRKLSNLVPEKQERILRILTLILEDI